MQMFDRKEKKEKNREPEKKEFILSTDLSFDHVIGRLNKIIYRRKHGGGTDTLKLLAYIEKCSDSTKVLNKLKEYLLVNCPLESIRDIFDEYHLTPWVGEKSMTKQFGNKDIVIGLVCDILKYRVDYDETKGLHINILLNGISIAIRLPPISKRFSADDEQFTNESQRAEFIKCKFWIKMTLSYYLSQNDFPSAFAPFLRSETYSFAAFKACIINYVEKGSKIYNQIEACRNERDLAKDVFSAEEIRDYLIGHLVKEYTKNKIHVYKGREKSEESKSHSVGNSSSISADSDSSDSDSAPSSNAAPVKQKRR